MIATEVMRKALEALELADRCMGGSSDPMLLPRTHRTVELTIPALRAEIERLEAVEPVAYRWQPSKFFADFVLTADAGRAALAREFGLAVESLYTAPIAPAIPALTIMGAAGRLRLFEPAKLQNPESAEGFHFGARWAYALAAQRAGVQIKDPMQELADDSKQIGLEY